jgi:hypothetical protein
MPNTTHDSHIATVPLPRSSFHQCAHMGTEYLPTHTYATRPTPTRLRHMPAMCHGHRAPAYPHRPVPDTFTMCCEHRALAHPHLHRPHSTETRRGVRYAKTHRSVRQGVVGILSTHTYRRNTRQTQKTKWNQKIHIQTTEHAHRRQNMRTDDKTRTQTTEHMRR